LRTRASTKGIAKPISRASRVKVSVLRQAAANSGSGQTRVKLAVPTHSGGEPGVYFWKAITTARIAGYQEKSAKQIRPPRRKP